MVKFNELIKLKTITAFIVFVKYFLWCFFFIFQGKAIDLAIEKNKLQNELMYTLAGYILIKLMVMLCDIFQKFILEYYKNIELNRQWDHHLPKNIYNDNQNNKNNINALFFDYLPRLFEVKIALVSNHVTIGCVFALTMAAFLASGFFLGLLALSLVFILNSLSKNIFVKKIDTYQKESYHCKIKILNWIDQYFFSYREISKNWPGIANSNWKNDIYRHYFIAKKNQAAFYLYRDLLAQVLVELPFLLNTSLVIVGVYYGFLSLTQLFIWVGFSQFMINASNSYLENRINKKQLITLTQQITSILQCFSPQIINQRTENKFSRFLFSNVVMQDGEINRLALKPGLYPIKGGNGSGKSTLMNIVLGYERGTYDFKSINLSYLIATIGPPNVRVIERETVLFECLVEFNRQICGPIPAHEKWQKRISYSLTQLLTLDLAKKWMAIFIALEAEYIHRQNQLISSGEKVILSLMRFFASWNTDVKLLLIDECDSFLDFTKKTLFIKTVRELALHMAVYISCHDVTLNQCLETPMESAEVLL